MARSTPLELTGETLDALEARAANAGREVIMRREALRDAIELRDALIVELRDAGVEIAKVAVLTGVSTTRVDQVMAEKG